MQQEEASLPLLSWQMERGCLCREFMGREDLGTGAAGKDESKGGEKKMAVREMSEMEGEQKGKKEDAGGVEIYSIRLRA